VILEPDEFEDLPLAAGELAQAMGEERRDGGGGAFHVRGSLG